MHPLGLAPVIIDDENTIAESGAIVRKREKKSTEDRSANVIDGSPHRIPTTEVREGSGSGPRTIPNQRSLLCAPSSRVRSELNCKAERLCAGEISVTHYAEGSLMPILMSKIMCKRVPERAPLLLKPLLWGVFDAVSSRMIAPRLDTHREYVRPSRHCKTPTPS